MTSSVPLQAQLAAGTCEPCRKTTPALSQEDQTSLLKQLAKGWKLEPFTGSGQLSVLQRSYTFKNFRYALAFANAVGAIAESQKHHPELLIGWGHVEVAWWSHAIGGVSVEGDDGERFSIDQSLLSFIRMTSSAQPRQTKRRETLKVSSQTCKSIVYSECKVVYQLQRKKLQKMDDPFCVGLEQKRVLLAHRPLWSFAQGLDPVNHHLKLP
jgi:4a-hydroxytetrahydrobiopterin dehydratase